LLLHHTADAVVAPDVAVGNVAVSYRVTAPTRPKAVRVRHLVAVTGQVRPAQTPGTKVLLQRWSSGAWRTVATGRTAAHSNYRVTWTPGQPGSNALRVVKPRDAVRSAGTSATWHQKISPENAADIAADILRNKRVTLAIVHESGVRDGATVLQNIRDVAHGRLAHRSAYQNAPGGSTAVKLGLLRAIRQMGLRLHVSVSEIAGGSHAPDSGHYQGRAVDVNVVNGVSVAGGASYGVVVSICHANGATTVFDPGYDPFGGHSNHVHCGWD
jgi:hypothetical protein